MAGSLASGPRQAAVRGIDLKRVSLRTTSTQIVATFRIYVAPPQRKMSAPWCGPVGINFAALHLTVRSSNHLVEEADGH